MLKYTQAALHKIVDEIAFLAHLFKMLMSIISIVYLIAICFIKPENFPISAALLVITFVCFISYLAGRRKFSRRSKNINAGIGRSARIVKILLNAANLASVIYMIYAHAGSVEMIRLVVTPLLIIAWILQVALEIISVYVRSRCTLFIDGVTMDFEPALKAKEGINNAVHSFFGEDKDEKHYISEHNREVLEKRAGIDAVKNKEKKAAKWKLRKKRLSYLFGEKLSRKKKNKLTEQEKIEK